MPHIDPEDIIGSEVIEHAPATNERSVARRVALQVLYEVDSAGHPVGEVLQGQLDHHDLRARVRRYVQQLVTGVLKHKQELDHVLQHYAPEWPLDQVAIIDRNILRMAILEFAVIERAPVKVAIDEAVQLAKLFGADGASRFVNGVLGAIVDEPDVLEQFTQSIEPFPAEADEE